MRFWIYGLTEIYYEFELWHPSQRYVKSNGNFEEYEEKYHPPEKNKRFMISIVNHVQSSDNCIASSKFWPLYGGVKFNSSLLWNILGSRLVIETPVQIFWSSFCTFRFAHKHVIVASRRKDATAMNLKGYKDIPLGYFETLLPDAKWIHLHTCAVVT